MANPNDNVAVHVRIRSVNTTCQYFLLSIVIQAVWRFLPSENMYSITFLLIWFTLDLLKMKKTLRVIQTAVGLDGREEDVKLYREESVNIGVV